MHLCVVGPAHDVVGGITESHKAWLKSSAVKGLRLEHFPTTRATAFPQRMCFMFWAVVRFGARGLLGRLADVVHVQMASRRSFYRKLIYILLARGSGVPVVVQIHGSGFEQFRSRNGWNRRLVDWGLGRASVVLVLHGAMQRAVQQWTGDSTVVEVVYNGVVLADYETAPEAGEREPMVLFLGEVGQRKGVWDLAVAAGRVINELGEARFVFAGQGDLQGLSAALRESGAGEHSEVVGWVDENERRALHARASVLCLPSYAEQLPMSILEAMATGTPVVSTRVAGIPEIVEHERSGLLVRPGDVEGLSEALGRLLREPSLRTRLGRAARLRALDAFDHEVIGQRLVACWRSALLESGVSGSLEGTEEAPAGSAMVQEVEAVTDSEGS